MSKLSFRARALDASKPMPIYLAEELPDLPEYSAINRAVPQMPSGMEKEEECEHHLQRAICTGLIIPTPEVCEVLDLEFYERCYPPDYKMPKQHIHMQPLWQEQETPEYDIDSEDERWLKQQRHPELTELKFEQMMDKLEKSSGQTVVTLNEAKLLLERHDDLVIAVYDYWLNKRLKTQHPLNLSVKTESRPGQSANNPYLAFRRRTEKMQTRKNRKNDESSYEKMLKLRRDLARALTLLEFVARRERAKRDLVKLTALLADRRYAAGDFASQLLPEPPPRPQYTAVQLPSPASYRREYSAPHYPPRAPPTPVDQPRQREKRPYKRRKHRHHAVGSTQGLRDSGVYTSSDEEASSPPDDGPFAFRRKPGCFYEMPTSTLYGDPLDPDSPSKDGLFEHDLDERHRFTLTSVRHPYPHCIGFARRRLCRGGRVALDRRATPLDDLWRRLDFSFPNSSEYRREREEEVELETKAHRNPKVLSRDYHSGGKHPWRHTFRRHLAEHSDLWTSEIKDDDVKPIDDIKMDLDDVRLGVDDGKIESDKVLPDLMLPQEDSVKSDISVNMRTVDSAVRENLGRVIRKRSWSGCSDSSYDSDESLLPVEQEFKKFVNEVNKKWLHFRPKTPPPSPPSTQSPTDDRVPLTLDMPLTVELRAAEQPSLGTIDPFTTSEFTLGSLYPEVINHDTDNNGLDVSGDDLLNENLGLTEAQVESILSETDLKALADVDLTKDDKKISLSEDILEELVKDVEKDPFLSHGQSSEGRANSGQKRKRADTLGSSVVLVSPLDTEPVYAELPEPCAPARAPARPPRERKPEPGRAPVPHDNTLTPKQIKVEEKPTIEPPSPVPTSKIIVEEVNEVPPQHIKVEKKRKEDTFEEVQLAHGVQLKTVQTKHSPLKKHIITSAAHRRGSDVALVTSEAPQPQIVTVAVSDSLKVRLQNHLVSAGGTAGGVVGLVQNGPFAAVAVPTHRDTVASVANVAGVATAVPTRRVSAPIVQLTGSAGVGAVGSASSAKTVGGVGAPVMVAAGAGGTGKLKVLHAHPLTHAQRAHLLAHTRPTGIAQLPAVVSLATLGEAKATNTAALLKAAPGSVAQLFEIKGGQLGKGTHLVNVVRQPPPGKTTVARIDLNDAKKRQVVATFDGTLKGNLSAAARPHRVSVSLDGRQLVRAALPAVRSPHVRHQIQLKNRTLQVGGGGVRCAEPSSSITIAAAGKPAAIPGSVVANLLHKNVQLPKGGQKISISGPGGQPLSANVQAIAFTGAQLKARQARLITQPRAQPVAEIVEATTAPVATSSTASNISGETPIEGVSDSGEAATNGGTLPMEVT